MMKNCWNEVGPRWVMIQWLLFGVCLASREVSSLVLTTCSLCRKGLIQGSGLGFWKFLCKQFFFFHFIGFCRWWLKEDNLLWPHSLNRTYFLKSKSIWYVTTIILLHLTITTDFYINKHEDIPDHLIKKYKVHPFILSLQHHLTSPLSKTYFRLIIIPL